VRPPAPPQTIRNLKVAVGTAPAAAWHAAGNLRAGQKRDGKSEGALTKFPNELSDSDWILPPPAENEEGLKIEFDVADHSDVYVGVSVSPTEPDWLRDWTRQTGTLQIGSESVPLYKKHFPLGAHVELKADPAVLRKAAGGAANVSDAQKVPASHLRAIFARPVRAVDVYPIAGDGTAVVLSKDHPTHAWQVAVGVGDRYGIAFQLRLKDGPATKLRYELLDRSGKVLCSAEDTVTSRPRETDTYTWRHRTCTSINAGTYLVRLTWLEGPPIQLHTLAVE
jgi:hypothetical protein